MGASNPWSPSKKKADHARWLFLKAVNGNAPDALRELHNVVLPLYSAIPDASKKECIRGPTLKRLSNPFNALFNEAQPVWETIRFPDLLLWRNLDFHAERTPEVQRLKAGLSHWSARFHLTDTWLLEAALATLYSWDNSSKATREYPRIYMQWHFAPDASDVSPFTPEEREIVFTHEGWFPGLQSCDEFEATIRANFDDLLKQYGKRLIELAKARGWTQLPQIRNPKHFDWLALYQVKGRSPLRIGRETRSGSAAVDPNTVFKAVQKTASQIGLTLRPSMTGKPQARTR